MTNYVTQTSDRDTDLLPKNWSRQNVSFSGQIGRRGILEGRRYNACSGDYLELINNDNTSKELSG